MTVGSTDGHRCRRRCRLSGERQPGLVAATRAEPPSAPARAGEPAIAGAGGAHRAAPGGCAPSQGARARQRAGAKRFVGESVGELRKVEWPGQSQVIQGTVVVIIACVIIGTYLYFADQVFSKLVSKVSPRAVGRHSMFQWYVINTYSGHENKVKTNLLHRIDSMNQGPRFRRVVVPTEQVIETKDGQKVQTEKRVLPGLRAGQHGSERRRLDGREEHARA